MKSEMEVLREALDLAKAKLCMLEKYSNIDKDRRVEIAREGTLGIAAILSQSTTPSREERLEVALEVLRAGIAQHREDTSTVWPTLHKAIKEADRILEPPPEYEEVEVVRWVCLVSEEGCGSTYREQDLSTTPADSVPCTCCGKTAFRMVGTIKREKPRKVQRKLSAVAVNGGVNFKTTSEGYPRFGTPCTVTWEEQP